MRIGFIALLGLLGGSLGGQTPEIWQGSFETKGVWGAMEIEMTPGPGSQSTLRTRFTPKGNLETPDARSQSISRDRISFVAGLSDVDHTFEGLRKGQRWTGTIDGPERTGTWTLTQLLPATALRGQLPVPSGPLAVGRVEFDWTDDQRAELETKDDNDRRRLMVYVFYPAQQKAGAIATYLPDATEMSGDWRPEQIEIARKVQGHSFDKAQCRRTDRPFPVVIFAPGGGQKALSYTALLEDLASHGFVVAAIDPPYNAQAVRYSDGTVLKRLPPDKRGWEVPATRDDMPRIYEQMVLHWSRDMIFVLNRLIELNRSDAKFARRLDLAHVGAIGHSRGGQAAGKVRLLDARFTAAINLDGNIRGRGFPPDQQGEGGKQPFLWIEKQVPWPKKDFEGLTLQQFDDMWANGDRLMKTIAADSVRMQIARPEIDHLDFGDSAMLNAGLDERALRGKERTLTITRKAALTFFSRHLKADKRYDLERLKTDFPEVKILRFRGANTQ
jgi:predicted dienelactone hydrolase